MKLSVNCVTSVQVFAVVTVLFSGLSICINILISICRLTEGPTVTFAGMSAISCRIQLILVWIL